MLRLTVDYILYSTLGLDPQARAVEVLDFFIYDSVKILSLLFGMIAAIGFARSYLPLARLRQWLGARGSSYFFASLFGAVTPFCSCSSIPIFISFLRAGIPLGVAFSFLVTSPLINEYLVVLMLGSFGLKITTLYVVSGIAIGVVSGALLGRMKLEKYLEKDIASDEAVLKEIEFTGIGSRVRYGIREAVSIVQKLWAWILLGVGIGALIHNYIPSESIHNIVGKAGVFSVPLAALLGVPLYGSCASIVPIAVVLFQKGVPLGTALAFMMAVSALSAPEAIMLRRAMRLPLIALFFLITTMAIIAVGYLFNFIR